MDLLAPFSFRRFPGQDAPTAAERRDQPTQDDERPRFIGAIPFVGPLAATFLAAVIYYIFWSLWTY